MSINNTIIPRIDNKAIDFILDCIKTNFSDSNIDMNNIELGKREIKVNLKNKDVHTHFVIFYNQFEDPDFPNYLCGGYTKFEPCSSYDGIVRAINKALNKN